MEEKAIFKNIEKTFLEKKNSHAFLFETNNQNKCYDDILNLIKDVTNHEFDNLIDNDNFPDLVHIQPDGKDIKVGPIENLLKSFETTSIMGSYSIYVISDADKMNISASNKILKFLEEPEKNIIGFFISNNINKILPTIKSRCEIFKIKYKITSLQELLELNDEQNELVEETIDFAFKLNSNKKYILMNDNKNIAKKERNEIETFLDILRKMYIIKYEYLLKRLLCDNDIIEKVIVSVECDDVEILAKRIKLIEQMQNEFKYNLNKELLLNKMILMWE